MQVRPHSQVKASRALVSAIVALVRGIGDYPRLLSLCSVTKSCPVFCNPIYCSTLAFLSFTISQSFLKFVSFESVMLSSHFICHLLLLTSVFSIQVFSNELALHVR